MVVCACLSLLLFLTANKHDEHRSSPHHTPSSVSPPSLPTGVVLAVPPLPVDDPLPPRPRGDHLCRKVGGRGAEITLDRPSASHSFFLSFFLSFFALCSFSFFFFIDSYSFILINLSLIRIQQQQARPHTFFPLLSSLLSCAHPCPQHLGGSLATALTPFYVAVGWVWRRGVGGEEERMLWRRGVGGEEERML